MGHKVFILGRTFCETAVSLPSRNLPEVDRGEPEVTTEVTRKQTTQSRELCLSIENGKVLRTKVASENIS